MDSVLMVGTGFFAGWGIVSIQTSLLNGFTMFAISLGLFAFATFYENHSREQNNEGDRK